MASAATVIYSMDSSSLIHAWHRIYRPKNFGFVWDGFDTLISARRLRASVEVYNELQKKDDELFAWCKKRKLEMFADLDEITQTIVAQIMRDHPKLVDTTKGRSGADPLSRWRGARIPSWSLSPRSRRARVEFRMSVPHVPFNVVA
jgi:hypothetical protein